MKSIPAIRTCLYLFVITSLPALIVSGCTGNKPTDNPSGQKVILYAEFMHEVNSFSPVTTAEVNFKADHLFYGEDVPASAIEEDKQLAGFLSAVEKSGRGRIKAV
ncbi:MAG: M81 family metallopeptidase, partial [Bacteroidales bacterium]|nr:M81 family metallopeptidase [Bacteroidales bacterium]